MNYDEKDKLQLILLNNIKKSLSELEMLLSEVTNGYNYEDHFYRFYHQSFKVFYSQKNTERMVEALKGLLPEVAELNHDFMDIVISGTGFTFQHQDNKIWFTRTLPMLQAFNHAKFFLEMAIKYGKEYDEAQNSLTNGYAALLYLFGLR